MSRYYGIGRAARKLQAKLADQLAGPLAAYLPEAWIRQVLGQIGCRFRETAFSPSDHSVGLHRPGPGPGPVLQSRADTDSGSPRGHGTSADLQ
jgi:hypothetical protein